MKVRDAAAAQSGTSPRVGAVTAEVVVPGVDEAVQVAEETATSLPQAVEAWTFFAETPRMLCQRRDVGEAFLRVTIAAHLVILKLVMTSIESNS